MNFDSLETHLCDLNSTARDEIVNNPLFSYLADDAIHVENRMRRVEEDLRRARVQNDMNARNISTLNRLLMEYESRMAAMESVIRRMLTEPVGTLSYSTQAIMEQEIARHDNVTDDLQRLLDEWPDDEEWLHDFLEL